MKTRRDFMKTSLALGGVIASGGIPLFAQDKAVNVPSYLKGYEDLYAQDPHKAALAWFRDARFGLFMHYGLYSILGQGEWVLYRSNIPIPEYERLTEQFNPNEFDADFITDLALEAGMKYINLTSKHHDGFCLFNSANDNWNSVAVAKRDLCRELATQCQKKGLGCFFYYSLPMDWHHPYSLSREFGQYYRPDYAVKPDQFKFEKVEDLQKYLDDARGHLRTLLSDYGPVAGLWFDTCTSYYMQPDLFPLKEIYAMVRKIQPNCLISFKQGCTGTEDFAAPERKGRSMATRLRNKYGDRAGDLAAHAWEQNKDKYNEICDTLQPGGWGYREGDDGKHRSPDEVIEMLKAAGDQNSNLLLNTGPLPDGSIHSEDITTLKEVGKRLRA
ncbi:alpha-L-fucosidase [Planctomycetota bacterium]